jgi:hypothetical protein
MLDQASQVIRDRLLRADQDVNRDGLLREQLRVDQVFRGADARYLGRDVKQAVGDLAGHHVGLIAVGDREHHVCVFGPGLLQHIGVGRMADDGAQIEALLQLLQAGRIEIDDGDVVLLAH